MWLLSTYFAKIIKFLVLLFKRGTGNTLPGNIILKIFPDILSQFKCDDGIILISGTNGKTTTTKLTVHLLEKQSLKVVTNRSGANLLRGIVTTALLNTDFFGRVRGDIAVFEVDEFALPQVLQYVTPSILVLLNLSRDQLDRYGEIDAIADRWGLALKGLSDETTLLVFEGQKEFKTFPALFSGTTVFFDSDNTLLNQSSLLGDFNARNINAAVSIMEILGYKKEDYIHGLSDFNAAYGRGEVITKDRQDFRIFLAKNPASFNHNLELLISDSRTYSDYVFVLNDNIPDGRDVSWIYDIDPLLLSKACMGRKVHVSGTRAYDMLVRLMYAGVAVSEDSLISYEDLTALGESVVILPNYSAMLEVRNVLIGRSIL